MTTVYVDMDGVLADFDSGMKDFGANIKKNPGWKSYSDREMNMIHGTDFFSSLPKYPSANELILMVSKMFGSYSICTSPPHGDEDNTRHQKLLWLRNNIQIKPVSFILTTNKEKYAKGSKGQSNILIDDRIKNIKAWQGAGGIGILYRADVNDLEYLRDQLIAAKKIIKLSESASAGATSAGSIACIANPQISPGTARKKKSYTGSPGKPGTVSPPQPKPVTHPVWDNALDHKANIFGQIAKR